MSNVLVTIIIPVYNVEKYLKKCLESVAIQEYKNLEIIAINDGSTDSSLVILNSYQEVFKNYKIITQKNKGQGAARNVGIDYITGKYTYFLDSDDYILPETIINLVKLAEKKKLDLIRFDALPFVDEGLEFSISLDQYNSKVHFSSGVLYDNKEFILANNLKAFRVSVCLHFIKSSVIKEYNLRFKEIKHEDELFIAMLYRYCHKIMYDPMQYFQRRYRPNSTMTSNILNSKDSFNSLVVVIQELEKIMAFEEIPKYYKDFLRNKNVEIYHQLLSYKIDKKSKKSVIQRLEKEYEFKGRLRVITKAFIKRLIKKLFK